MGVKPRREFRLQLAGPAIARGEPSLAIVGMRSPAFDDIEPLAALMMDAYAGKVEGVGQDPSPPREELERWFKGTLGRAMPECSTVAWTQGRPEAACLVGWWGQQSMPWVQYVFTRSASKRRGFGGAVLIEALRMLGDSGHREVRAQITQGNEAAEGLFQKAGFVVVPELIA